MKQEATWYEALILGVLKEGPIPNHLAFIMDGNRRFAKQRGLSKEMGTEFGAKSLNRICFWLHYLGVRELTIYAFSIENFNRDQLEIDTYMKYFRQFLDEMEKQKFKFRVKFIGNITLFEKDLQDQMKKCVEATKHFEPVLNVYVGYTSRDDITNSMKIILKQVEDGELDPKDIDSDLVTKNLYTNVCTVPDMLIRTSGETRLSDFLLWETSESIILFIDELWPDLGLGSLVKFILFYQFLY